MNYKEAINASQIWAARGYDDTGVCVVTICFYDGKTMWRPGFGGNWAKNWEGLPEDGPAKIAHLRFAPTGPKPDEQVQAELLDILGNDDAASYKVSDDEMQAALAEIGEEYEWADELRDDYHEPMGETYD